MFAFDEDRAASLQLGLGRRSAVPGQTLNQETLKHRGTEDTESYRPIFLCELCGSVFQNIFAFQERKQPLTLFDCCSADSETELH